MKLEKIIKGITVNEIIGVRYLCELTESAKFFNFREAQRRPRNPLPNIRVIYAVKVWIRLLYIDKGGVRLTLLKCGS